MNWWQATVSQRDEPGGRLACARLSGGACPVPGYNDLVQLTNALSPGLKQRGRTGTWVFKKAMEPSLPLDVIYR